MLSRLCSLPMVSKTLVTHEDGALAPKSVNITPNPGKLPVGVLTSEPGIVAPRSRKLLTAIDKNKVPFFCQVVGQSSGPGTWVWPGSSAPPGELTPVPEVQSTNVFLTSCHTLFYGCSRKATRD